MIGKFNPPISCHDQILDYLIKSDRSMLIVHSISKLFCPNFGEKYASKHEGYLVANCYFSKGKIVWEVVDAGLKKKFESFGLKANFAPNGRGSLTIVLDKPPIFYKEINPKPSTQWQSTSDITNGEAGTQRQHILQCAQGLLDKHYEMLIQCDT